MNTAAIITCSTSNRKWLYEITNTTKIRYANLYQIDYLFDDSVYYDTSYLPGWNKIPYILDALNKYQNVMWLDDDAGFIRYDVDVINYCINISNGRSIVICKDLNGLNSGVMFFKSCAFTINALQYLWNNRALYKNDNHGHTGHMEQPAIIDLCLKRPMDVMIGDGHILNAYDSSLTISEPNQATNDTIILHIAGGSEFKQQHINQIKALYETNR